MKRLVCAAILFAAAFAFPFLQQAAKDLSSRRRCSTNVVTGFCRETTSRSPSSTDLTSETYFEQQEHCLWKRWKLMQTSARKSSLRMTHSSLGFLSMTLGLHHSLNLCIQGWTTLFNDHYLLFLGVLHTRYGCCGYSAFGFSQSTRNVLAQFWSVSIFNATCTTANRMDSVVPVHAPLSMYGMPSSCFGLVTVGLVVYTLYETARSRVDGPQSDGSVHVVSVFDPQCDLGLSGGTRVSCWVLQEPNCGQQLPWMRLRGRHIYSNIPKWEFC